MRAKIGENEIAIAPAIKAGNANLEASSRGFGFTVHRRQLVGGDHHAVIGDALG